MIPDLKLGDVVVLGGLSYVVATITGVPPFMWALVQVPAGKQPLDLGKTWTRSESPDVPLTLTRQQAAPVSVSLEPPLVPAPPLPGPPPPFVPPAATLEGQGSGSPQK